MTRAAVAMALALLGAGCGPTPLSERPNPFAAALGPTHRIVDGPLGPAAVPSVCLGAAADRSTLGCPATFAADLGLHRPEDRFAPRPIGPGPAARVGDAAEVYLRGAPLPAEAPPPAPAAPPP